MSIYDFHVSRIDGRDESLEIYRDKVLLIVNVASRCGFTPQYKGLEEVYQRFKGRGFEVLGFPCNQFGSQEPGSDEEIGAFCDLNYQVTFPLFRKIEVNGKGTHPLYVYLKKKGPGLLGLGRIQWNFTKFLVDRQGEVVRRYAPITTPAKIAEDIESQLQCGSNSKP